jgi:hypothetical protein
MLRDASGILRQQNDEQRESKSEERFVNDRDGQPWLAPLSLFEYKLLSPVMAESALLLLSYRVDLGLWLDAPSSDNPWPPRPPETTKFPPNHFLNSKHRGGRYDQRVPWRQLGMRVMKQPFGLGRMTCSLPPSFPSMLNFLKDQNPSTRSIFRPCKTFQCPIEYSNSV